MVTNYTCILLLQLIFHINCKDNSTDCKQSGLVNPLKPNDPYSGRTAQLTSKRCILYIYSTNIGTEYFKHGIYSPCFSLQNAVCFIILTYLVPVLFSYTGCAKIKKNSCSKTVKEIRQSNRKGNTLLANCLHQKDTNVKVSAFVKKIYSCGIMFFNTDTRDSVFQL